MKTTLRQNPPCYAPPTWRELIAAGCAAAGSNRRAFLSGVWQALNTETQGKLPLFETQDDLKERRQLTLSLLREGSPLHVDDEISAGVAA